MYTSSFAMPVHAWLVVRGGTGKIPYQTTTVVFCIVTPFLSSSKTFFFRFRHNCCYLFTYYIYFLIKKEEGHHTDRSRILYYSIVSDRFYLYYLCWILETFDTRVEFFFTNFVKNILVLSRKTRPHYVHYQSHILLLIYKIVVQTKKAT